MSRRRSTRLFRFFFILFSSVVLCFVYVAHSQVNNRRLQPIAPVYIFLHLPKTGGTLLRVILQHWCRATNRSFVETDYDNERGVLLRDRISDVSMRNAIDVWFGHLPFGVHKLLELNRPVKYFTVFRDPVKQAVSAFHFIRCLEHHLGGAFVLQAAISKLNKTIHSPATSIADPARVVQLDHERNGIISLLTGRNIAFRNVVGCFADFGGANAWLAVHNVSARQLQTLDSESLVQFAARVVDHAWKANCTAPLSRMLLVSFEQFIGRSKYLSDIQNRYPRFWHFGDNPVTTTYCCYPSWFNHTSREDGYEQAIKCPEKPTEDTLQCALTNMEQLDLVMIAENIPLSLRLLENFLGWRIPEKLKRLQINEAVYVTPPPPKITPRQLTTAERYVQLDRNLYQAAVGKFWKTVHSTNILPM